MSKIYVHYDEADGKITEVNGMTKELFAHMEIELAKESVELVSALTKVIGGDKWDNIELVSKTLALVAKRNEVNSLLLFTGDKYHDAEPWKINQSLIMEDIKRGKETEKILIDGLSIIIARELRNKQ